MTREWLNVEIVELVLKSRGVSKKWLWETHLGLKRSHGYTLLSTGLLPEDAAVRNRIVSKLSEFTGKDRSELILTPEAKRAAS